MSERRVAILKKVSLEGLADGWGAETYVTVQPASYQEFKEYTQTDVEKMNEAQGIDLITSMIKKKFVSGKIMILDDNGKPELVDAEVGDMESLSIEMLNEIFTKIMGVNYDPKATPMDPAPKMPSLNSGNDTEKQS